MEDATFGNYFKMAALGKQQESKDTPKSLSMKQQCLHCTVLCDLCWGISTSLPQCENIRGEWQSAAGVWELLGCSSSNIWLVLASLYLTNFQPQGAGWAFVVGADFPEVRPCHESWPCCHLWIKGASPKMQTSMKTKRKVLSSRERQPPTISAGCD